MIVSRTSFRRLSECARVVRLTTNWWAVLRTRFAGGRLSEVHLRGGRVLRSPAELGLAFLFQEVWVDEVYCPPGYRISAGQTVIDVGASVGVFAVYAATRAVDVRVVACEPFPASYEWLCRNVRDSRLGNIVSLPVAVGGSVGRRDLLIHAENWLLHSLSNPQPGPMLSVRCVNLPLLLDENGGACHLLKLDCEGAEHEILEACDDRTLSRISRVVAEFHTTPDGSRNGETLCALLSARGFEIDYRRETAPGVGYLAARRHGTRPQTT